MDKKSGLSKAFDLAISTLYKELDREGYISIILIIVTAFVVLISRCKKIKKKIKKKLKK